jgi:hypothetical protein
VQQNLSKENTGFQAKEEKLKPFVYKFENKCLFFDCLKVPNIIFAAFSG